VRESEGGKGKIREKEREEKRGKGIKKDGGIEQSRIA